MPPKRIVGATVMVQHKEPQPFVAKKFFIACGRCKGKVQITPVAIDVIKLTCNECGLVEEKSMSEVIDVC